MELDALMYREFDDLLKKDGMTALRLFWSYYLYFTFNER